MNEPVSLEAIHSLSSHERVLNYYTMRLGVRRATSRVSLFELELLSAWEHTVRPALGT